MINNNISKELFEQWLGEYYGLYVFVLPKKTFGLPKHLTTEIVTLFIGLNMPIPIPDLSVNDHEWTGTLSFNKRPYYIQCPLNSVVHIVGSSGGEKNTTLFDRKVTKEMLDAIAPAPLPEVVSSDNVVAVDFRNRKRK